MSGHGAKTSNGTSGSERASLTINVTKARAQRGTTINVRRQRTGAERLTPQLLALHAHRKQRVHSPPQHAAQLCHQGLYNGCACNLNEHKRTDEDHNTFTELHGIRATGANPLTGNPPLRATSYGSNLSPAKSHTNNPSVPRRPESGVKITTTCTRSADALNQSYNRPNI